MRLVCPAKLNLYLAVLGRRRDGYHDLCTLFHRIALADELRIEPTRRRGLQLRVASADGRPMPGLQGRSNLIAKAFERLASRFNLRCGFQVHLTKRIPIGAGLGGGSSDAAAFLLAAARLARLKLSKRNLLALGAGLGADVPFFLLDVPQAVGVGRGERLTPLARGPRLHLVLVCFPFSLSTRRVYEHCLKHLFSPIALTKAKADVRLLSNYLRSKDLPQVSECLRNDLAGAALSQKGLLFEAWRRLRDAGGIAGCLTGSGPTLFAMFGTERDAHACARRMADPRWTLRVTRSA